MPARYLNVIAYFKAICPIDMSFSVINYLEMLTDFNIFYLIQLCIYICIYSNDDAGGLLCCSL
jgi:hypothetical protein